MSTWCQKKWWESYRTAKTTRSGIEVWAQVFKPQLEGRTGKHYQLSPAATDEIKVGGLEAEIEKNRSAIARGA